MIDIPKDNAILLSWVNTKLRDEYASLSELCRALDIDRQVLETKLQEIGVEYDEMLNKFW